MECVSACDPGAIRFSFNRPFKRRKGAERLPDPEGRRKFLIGALSSAFGAVCTVSSKASLLEADLYSTPPIIPPGGKSIDSFLERCVACNSCTSVCPTRVLEPAGLENSLAGLGKVRMNYGKSYCSYECNACLAVCPTGAISYYQLQVKKKIKLGSSSLDKSACVPYAKEKECAACHESCPTGAITMKKHKSVKGPILNDDYCIGCGACQHACPILPVKAIVVAPREVHTFAFNPKQHGPHTKHWNKIRQADVSEFPF